MSLCNVDILIYPIRLSNLLTAMVAKIAVAVHRLSATRANLGNCLAALFAIFGVAVVACTAIRTHVVVVTHGICNVAHGGRNFPSYFLDNGHILVFDIACNVSAQCKCQTRHAYTYQRQTDKTQEKQFRHVLAFTVERFEKVHHAGNGTSQTHHNGNNAAYLERKFCALVLLLVLFYLIVELRVVVVVL